MKPSKATAHNGHPEDTWFWGCDGCNPLDGQSITAAKVKTSKKQVMKDRIRRHQPRGGGYGVELECTCGATFNAAHQIQSVLDGWEAESK